MILKIFFDRIAAFIGLLLLSPLLLSIYSLIKLKMSDGPALFKQSRVGQYGKIFTIYKFRTMTMKHSQSSVTVAGENRITPLGKVLRKYKFDELPELWNVLIGEMSFVGPRPDVPGYADRLDGEDREILRLKPGITGPATIKYRNEEELLSLQSNPQKYNDEVIFPDKVKLNLQYLKERSFLGDIKIIIKTVIR